MKKISIILFVFFATIISADSQTILPVETTEFCPEQEIVFTVTVHGTSPNIVSWTNTPTLILGVYNSSYDSNTGITTFNFKGKFRDVNITQVFKLTYTSGGQVEKFFTFKNIKSLFYSRPTGSSCSVINPNQGVITAPLCQVSNIPISFNTVKWSTYGENPAYCFGTITTYEYQLPTGWVLNGATSTGSNWIVGSNNVTITSDLNTGGVVRIRPANNCGSNLQNGEQHKLININRPASFTLTSSPTTITCGTTTPVTFSINNNVSGITNYTWNLGATPNGWLLPNGSPAPATYSTGTTNTLTLTPVCGVAPANVSGTVTVNGTNCNTNTSSISISQPAMSISGSTSFCSGTSNYSINNLSCNTPVSWVSSDPGIATVTATGNPATVTKQSGNGNVTITATVGGSCFTNNVVSKTIAVGVPDPENISLAAGPAPPPPRYVTVMFRYDNLYPGNTFDVESADGYPFMSLSSTTPVTDLGNVGGISFSADFGLNRTIYVRHKNACGVGSWKHFAINLDDYPTLNMSQFSITPNPASNTVTVSQNTSSVSVQKNAKGTLKITEIRLFDQSGSLKKQVKYTDGTTQAKLNISGLKAGIYVIEISSGKKKERQQLIIQE